MTLATFLPNGVKNHKSILSTQSWQCEHLSRGINLCHVITFFQVTENVSKTTFNFEGEEELLLGNDLLTERHY